MEEKQIKKEADRLQEELTKADAEHHEHQELASKAYLRHKALLKEMDELREKCSHKYPKRSTEMQMLSNIDGTRHCSICGFFNSSHIVEHNS